MSNESGPRNRISRLTLIIDNIATDTGIHNAGDLATDSNILPNNLAQDRSSLNGKILRIKPQNNGTYTTEGNPYDADPNAFSCGKTRPPSTTYRCKEIFAYGFCNPFRFTLKPNSNSLFVGDVDPVVGYRVTLFLKDSAGQVSTITRDVFPETVPLKFQTNPPGGEVFVDGALFTTPKVITRVIGIHSAINVPATQLIGLQSYQFQSWSHGGAQLQQISAPASDTSYTANLSLIAASAATPGPTSPETTATPTQTPVESVTATATPTVTSTPISTPTATPTGSRLPTRYYAPIAIN